MTDVLIKEKNSDVVKKQADIIVNFRNELPDFIGQFANSQVNGSLVSIAEAKKATGSTELANYIQAKLPADAQPKQEIQLSADSLKKYTGDYALNSITIKVYVKDKTLFMLVPGQPEYPLSPFELNKFSIKTLAGFSVQFNTNDKGEVTELLSIQPNGTYTATKTK